MKNLKNLLLAGILAFSCSQTNAQTSFGIIKGQVLNNEGEPLFGATIKITQIGILVGGTTTDEKGNYTYKPLDAGEYEIIAQSIEMATQRVNKVIVKLDKTTYIDIKATPNSLTEFTVISTYEPPAFDATMISGQEMTGEELRQTPISPTDFKGAIANMTSEASQDASGDFHVRGGRAESTALIVDGVRTPNLTGISMLAVDNLAVITGGVPAQYGDATSGIVVIKTMDYFSGIRNKHIRENHKQEKLEKIKREETAKLEEEKRKKEIEEELKLEEEAKAKKM